MNITNPTIQDIYDRLCENAYMGDLREIECKYCGASSPIKIDPVTRFAGAYVAHFANCPLTLCELAISLRETDEPKLA